MAGRCSVCFHSKATHIDNELTRGVSQREVARRYRLGPKSVNRHVLSGHVRTHNPARVRVPGSGPVKASFGAAMVAAFERAETRFLAAVSAMSGVDVSDLRACFTTVGDHADRPCCGALDTHDHDELYDSLVTFEARAAGLPS